MSLQACADIVAKGDPDRFAAAMAAPVAARKVLLPLYAFNVEVARAPWVASEPMIGEMRLQWWRDALEEIGSGAQVRKHEVTTPLAAALSPSSAQALDRLVAARRWDLYKDPFEDEAHFDAYLTNTGGALMGAAAVSLGADGADLAAVKAVGKATALARFLQAVPALEARGRVPLVDGRAEAVRALARKALDDLRGVTLAGLPKAARPALIEAWQTRALLAQIISRPSRVAEGELGLSEFAKRWRLFRASFGANP